MSLDELIQTLTPPAVPGLANARALSRTLATCAPLPQPASLNPVLASLCGTDSPPALLVAGYDIMCSYWENGGAAALSTADRMSYFSLFLEPRMPWSQEVWEPRFRALRALVKGGAGLVSVEASFLKVLMQWIESACEGLFASETVELAEVVERERSVETLASFMSGVVETPEVAARLPEEDAMSMLDFYAGLLRRALDIPPFSSPPEPSTPSSPDPPVSSAGTPARPVSHRRNPSSLSIPSTATTGESSASAFRRHPADVLVSAYLHFLASQLKTLLPSQLDSILPLLFRGLAFYATTLARISITTTFPKSDKPEDRITETLNQLFTGPYSSTCMVVLKRHLFPPASAEEAILGVFMEMSVGAQRTLRNYVRRGLSSRLARAYINKELSHSYTSSGAPGHMDLERDLMERAWPKEDFSDWNPTKLGRVLSTSVEAWIDYNFGLEVDLTSFIEAREKILDEAAGTLRDILREIDMREDRALDDEEAAAAGAAMRALASYVHPLKNQDGSPFILPLRQPTDAPTVFLRNLAILLCRDHSIDLNPLLSTTLLSISEHLSDADTADLPNIMLNQHDLTPTSPDWLDNWEIMLANRDILGRDRPLTRSNVLKSLQAVYDSVKDMPKYRVPLADLVYRFCERESKASPEARDDADHNTMWLILGDEIVLRSVEADEAGQGSSSLPPVEEFVSLLLAVSSETEHMDMGSDADEQGSVITAEQQLSTSITAAPLAQPSAPLPVLSRVQSEYQSPMQKEKDAGMPSVMSILSSFTSSPSSRSQSQHPQPHDDAAGLSAPNFPPKSEASQPAAVGAVVGLISVFSQLAFTPLALVESHLKRAIRVFEILVHILQDTKSARARLAILQFLLRLRADRDHRLYVVHAAYDPDRHAYRLGSLIGRTKADSQEAVASPEVASPDEQDSGRSRARTEKERHGRKPSRGRGARLSDSASSRSRSRAAATIMPAVQTAAPSKPKDPLWSIPEALPFILVDMDRPSDGLVSYHPVDASHFAVLPFSDYLSSIVAILQSERDWEILSYVLCHLPVQLANKHLLCGPKSREEIVHILTTLCTGIINNSFGSGVENWPQGLRARDAHGLAYHTLSVLVSYRRCMDVKLRHLLVEVFQRGLDGPHSTITCCLHALSLSAFELQSSVTKCLPRILEKLSQIMSNPSIAVHIISFLSIVGSIRELQANFTDDHYKMVFGVALKYLQHRNRVGSSPEISWALSQHVQIMSYYLVYVWFLAVKLPDRPRHIPFITRQLLLANEENKEVDEPTEVCFDWLARYTYASADPRPAKSILTEIVTNPTAQHTPEIALSEKTWILGNSVVTIRSLARLGWVEVVSRRPSGVTRFLCRVENVPLIPAGDVDPDMFSIPAALLVDRTPSAVDPVDPESTPRLSSAKLQAVQDVFDHDDDGTEPPPRPDPVVGYVWSGTAPSQRRKDVDVDPAFFALQLSSYPHSMKSAQNRRITNTANLPRFVRTLDVTPVIDTHKVGILYVAPGQSHESQILRNTHGSPAYTRFLEGIGRLINLRGQLDVYVGQLDPEQHGEYAYAWWDDIGQILYHTATMMPSIPGDEHCINKKLHIGNDHIRIVWNDSGAPYRFDTLSTEFQFVNIVIEPHSLGAVAAFSNNIHENEYFKVTVQRAPGMTEFAPVGDFKLISAENLPLLVRQLSLLGDWFTSVFLQTEYDTKRVEVMTNWRSRLQQIKRFRDDILKDGNGAATGQVGEGILGQEPFRDFTTQY